MNLIGTLALMLLTVVGYSSGAVIARRGRNRSPGLWDLGLLVFLMAMSFWTRPILGKWLAIPIWIIIACLASAVLTEIWNGDGRAKKGVTSTSPVKSSKRWIWEWWKTFAGEMGNYQGRVLFAFFYFGVVALFGVWVRMFSDPLKLKQGGRTTFWLKRDPGSHELDAAREQF